MTDIDKNPLSASQMADAFGLEGAFRVHQLANSLDATLARSGQRVVHVEIGQPDFATPPHIIEAGLRSLRAGQTGYTTPNGIAGLRDAICGFVRPRGVTASPENIVVTPGGKCALYCALVSIVSPGDEVLVPDPGFPMYSSISRGMGGVPVFYPVTARDGVSADAIAALITPKTRVIVLNAPHNPTGSSISDSEMERIAALTLRHKLWLVSDEIYATLQFDGKFRSPLAIQAMHDRGIIVDSLSKSHAMPGFRAGFAIMPALLRETFVKVAVNVYSCSPTFVQYAAVEALTASQDCVVEMRSEYEARTKLVSLQLSALPGVSCAAPAGAFYVFPNVQEWFEASGSAAASAPTAHFADRVLNEALVAVLPGTDFGARGAGSIRLSCATSRTNLQEAVDRLARFGKILASGAESVPMTPAAALNSGF